jgi:sec-independent protein translocase protein TatB
MSFGETIFLFFLGLIIFGPKKLPEIARTVGKYLNEFKRASNEFRSQIEQEIAHLDTEKPKILPPTLTSASWAGDSHVTETLAPEGTASRTLNAANAAPAEGEAVSAEAATAEPSATLAAPLIEDSTGHENLNASTAPEPTTSDEAVSTTDPAPDPIKTSITQEFHA